MIIKNSENNAVFEFIVYFVPQVWLIRQTEYTNRVVPYQECLMTEQTPKTSLPTSDGPRRSALLILLLICLAGVAVVVYRVMRPTDEMQETIISSVDGATYTIETQAQRNRARGGVEDAVSDLSIGL